MIGWIYMSMYFYVLGLEYIEDFEDLS